jgi:riboflavin synthase
VSFAPVSSLSLGPRFYSKLMQSFSLPFQGAKDRRPFMFAGIIEAQSTILKSQEQSAAVRVWFSRPSFFNDLKIGDSIACNGICLTIEGLTEESIQFALAFETLRLLNLDLKRISEIKTWNLERSLRFGDRIHGHLVSGHVEDQAEVVKSEAMGDSWLLAVKLPESLSPWVWKKGCIAIHGVSLTVNEFVDRIVEVCLIPETQQRTNLAQLQKGEWVNIETDYLAKALVRGRNVEV